MLLYHKCDLSESILLLTKKKSYLLIACVHGVTWQVSVSRWEPAEDNFVKLILSPSTFFGVLGLNPGSLAWQQAPTEPAHQPIAAHSYHDVVPDGGGTRL